MLFSCVFFLFEYKMFGSLVWSIKCGNVVSKNVHESVVKWRYTSPTDIVFFPVGFFSVVFGFGSRGSVGECNKFHVESLILVWRQIVTSSFWPFNGLLLIYLLSISLNAANIFKSWLIYGWWKWSRRRWKPKIDQQLSTG